MKRYFFIFFYIYLVKSQVEYQSFDGLFNNPSHPTWGRTHTPLNRFIIPEYSDGSYLPIINRPNARILSNLVFKKLTPFSIPNQHNITALFTVFGQKLVQEITETVAPSCPPEYFNIPSLTSDSEFHGISQPFIRSLYEYGTGTSPNRPREILNEVTPFVDLGNIYGPNKPWSDVLRLHKNGYLKVNDKKFPPFNEIGLPMANPPPPLHYNSYLIENGKPFIRNNKKNFVLGNPRGNENPGIWVLHTLWIREHNRMADQLKIQNPSWNDSQLFHRARQFTIALYQNIVFNEWLPIFLNRSNPLEPYPGYSDSIHPQIINVFSTVAMRFGHTLVPPGFKKRNVNSCTEQPPIRLCNSFFNIEEEIQNSNGIEPIILGLASQITEEIDHFVVDDLRSFLFGDIDVSRRDLIALNIQRAREHGIPDYNTIRESFGMNRIKTFRELAQGTNPFCNSNCQLLESQLSTLYNNDINNIDPFVGGMLEINNSSGVMGPLFNAIITEQFKRLRNGDRFYFENTQNNLFSTSEINIIRQTKFSDIISRNIIPTTPPLQSNVFINNGNSESCLLGPLNEYSLNTCEPIGTYLFSNPQPIQIILLYIILSFIASLTFLYISKLIKMKYSNKISEDENHKKYLLQFMKNYSICTSQDSKTTALFMLFDFKNKGVLQKHNFKNMYKSLLNVSNVKLDNSIINEIVNDYFNNSNELTFEEFKNKINNDQKILLFHGSSARLSTFKKYNDLDNGNLAKNSMPKSYNNLNSKWISFLLFYFIFNVLIFLERSYVYGNEREHRGLRQITGYGVIITRGSASVISFNLSIIPLTVCRNLITILRKTRLNNYIPFEYSHEFHKISASVFALSSLIHLIGHTFNFYNISSTHPRDINCILEEIYILSDTIPNFFNYWIIKTTTGLSGLILSITLIVFLLFSLPVVRKYNFYTFWKIHQLYIVIYILTILHGSAQLIQPALFWHYSIASLLIFFLDKMSRDLNTKQLRILEIINYPSNVIYLKLEKPKNFNFRSGQWCYIQCPAINNSKHPFTITSASYEKFISFHIKTNGFWSNKLSEYEESEITPLVTLDGPFGEIHDNWDSYSTLMLIGAGIGITPFAAITKELINRYEIDKKGKDAGKFNVKEVYFFWISRNTKNFEWFAEFINEIEQYKFIKVYQFITGAFDEKNNTNFDFRSILFYIGEYKHRLLTGKSIMNNQNSPIYFGRPNWNIIFSRISNINSKKIGVFSCGPSGLHSEIKRNCSLYSKFDFYKEHF